MGGLHGVYSGVYDRRLQDKNEQLEAHRRLHQDLEVQSVALTKEYKLTDAKLTAERQQLLDLDAKIQLLAEQVTRQDAQSDRRQQEIKIIRVKIKQLQEKVQEQHVAIEQLDKGGGSSANPSQYQRIQGGCDQLAREYNGLMDM